MRILSLTEIFQGKQFKGDAGPVFTKIFRIRIKIMLKILSLWIFF